MVVKKEPLRPKNDFKIPMTVPLHDKLGTTDRAKLVCFTSKA